MKQTIMVFQDSDDARNGMVQLSIHESPKSFYVYFTLKEWVVFKEAVNSFRYSLKPEDFGRGLDSDANIDLEDNPCGGIRQDGIAVYITFDGCLAINLYYENSRKTPKNKLWEIFKRAVNDFVPEEVKE